MKTSVILPPTNTTGELLTAYKEAIKLSQWLDATYDLTAALRAPRAPRDLAMTVAPRRA